MKRIFPFIALLFFVLVTSCSEDENTNCSATKIARIDSVNAPETAIVNQPVEIEVTYVLSNSCGHFSRFVVSGSEKTRTVSVEARYEGCACLQVLMRETKTYEFTPSETGTYNLEFQNTPDNSFFVSINVSNPS